MDTGKANVVTGYELRPELRKFAEGMEKVLRKNDYKHGIPTDNLFYNMVRETYELNIALSKVNLFKPEITPKPFREQVIKEAIDVANYAMMIANGIK